jgi:hypothetical protein
VEEASEHKSLMESINSLIEKKEQEFFEQTFNKHELLEYATQQR